MTDIEMCWVADVVSGVWSLYSQHVFLIKCFDYAKVCKTLRIYECLSTTCVSRVLDSYLAISHP